jgi:hypothetical protein
MFNSFNCSREIVEGVSIITSRPELFLGNTMKSAPLNNEHKASQLDQQQGNSGNER